jgi:hypothetical protein
MTSTSGHQTGCSVERVYPGGRRTACRIKIARLHRGCPRHFVSATYLLRDSGRPGNVCFYANKKVVDKIYKQHNNTHRDECSPLGDLLGDLFVLTNKTQYYQIFMPKTMFRLGHHLIVHQRSTKSCCLWAAILPSNLPTHGAPA